MDMQETAILSITYLLVGVVLAVGIIGGIIFALTTTERTRRRKLVDSKRTIKMSAAGTGKDCEHLRSKSRARQEADGTIFSICKKCGVKMKRIGEGQWEPVA